MVDVHKAVCHGSRDIIAYATKWNKKHKKDPAAKRFFPILLPIYPKTTKNLLIMH